MRYIPFTVLAQILGISDPARYNEFYQSLANPGIVGPDPANGLKPAGNDVFVSDSCLQAYMQSAQAPYGQQVQGMWAALGPYFSALPGQQPPAAPPAPVQQQQPQQQVSAAPAPVANVVPFQPQGATPPPR